MWSGRATEDSGGILLLKRVRHTTVISSIRHKESNTNDHMHDAGSRFKNVRGRLRFNV